MQLDGSLKQICHCESKNLMDIICDSMLHKWEIRIFK